MTKSKTVLLLEDACNKYDVFSELRRIAPKAEMRYAEEVLENRHDKVVTLPYALEGAVVENNIILTIDTLKFGIDGFEKIAETHKRPIEDIVDETVKHLSEVLSSRILSPCLAVFKE